MTTLAHVLVVLFAALALAFQPGAGRSGRAPAGGDGADPNAAPSNEEWNAAVRPAGFICKSIDVNGVAHPYVVYAPYEHHPQSRQRRWPTIVFLHGSGECGTDGLKQVQVGIGQSILHDRLRWPFLVIFPQKPTQQMGWDEYQDVVLAQLAAVAKDYPVDTDRTYLTGLSQGGHGTWTIGANNPTLFAAIAPVCGFTNLRQYRADPKDLAQKLRATPVWAFHGEKDDVVPPSQTRIMINALKAAKPEFEPRMSIYPDANHNSWDKAYAEKELPEWFLSHSRAGR